MSQSKYAIILTGKLSYVGSDVWKETCLLPMLNAIPTDKNVDIICLVWDSDVPGAHTLSNWSGYSAGWKANTQDPPVDVEVINNICYWDTDRYYGNHPVKAETIEYLKTSYSISSNVTVKVLTINYYIMLNRLQEYYDIGKKPDNLYWQVQHFQLTEAFRLYPDIFENYEMFFKIRYDCRWAGQITLDTLYTNLNNWRLNDSVACSSWPTVLLQSDNINSIIGGTIYIQDAAFAFDNVGFKTFVENYERWVKADIYNRCTYYTKYDETNIINYGFNYSAERNLSRFFLDNYYNIQFNVVARGPIQKLEVWEDIPTQDDHRIRWYEYDIK